MYHNDFTGPTLKKENTAEMDELPVEDRRFLSLVEQETKLVDGHCHVFLPLRNLDAEFPNYRN